MQNGPEEYRKTITFAQAEGAEPLPQQLALKEVPRVFRARIFALLYESMKSHDYKLSSNWVVILKSWHITVRHLWIDDFDHEIRAQSELVKRIVGNGSYIEVFEFLQFILRHKDIPYQFERALNNLLRSSRMAYRVFDGNTIVPISNPEQASTIDRAFYDLTKSGFAGGRRHLRSAGEYCTKGSFADCIRESMHAVESVARVLEPSANELGPALNKLESSANVHRALKKGFSAIYGFTSDEKGIRHPLLEADAPAVDEVDALFMLGACAAFVSYLINKGRNAGLIGSD